MSTHPTSAADLPEGVTDTFTHLCKWCGATIQVIDGRGQPHKCRIGTQAKPPFKTYTTSPISKTQEQK